MSQADYCYFRTAEPPHWESQRLCAHNWGEESGDPLQADFLELAERWRRETGHLSVTRAMAMHPAYQEIIGMGDRALEFIFKDMEKEPDHWFWALEHITRNDPVPETMKGDIEKETMYWLAWARALGYLS
jgi:hypothetical protein